MKITKEQVIEALNIIESYKNQTKSLLDIVGKTNLLEWATELFKKGKMSRRLWTGINMYCSEFSAEKGHYKINRYLEDTNSKIMRRQRNIGKVSLLEFLELKEKYMI